MEMEMKIPDGNNPNFPIKIYTDGVFDCFHYGHALLLKHIKEMFPHVYLMVGVCGDEMTWKEKGKTILFEKERYQSVLHCKYTDEVVENAPWCPTVEFLDRIGAHYLAHDPEPYPMGDIADLYGDIKDKGRFLPTKRTDGISTSDIMMRIIRGYDEYVERNVKKGAKPEDLNISLNKFREVKLLLCSKKIKRTREIRETRKFGLNFYFAKWINNLIID
jgi:choline-phosphate cytidylyltransferase